MRRGLTVPWELPRHLRAENAATRTSAARSSETPGGVPPPGITFPRWAQHAARRKRQHPGYYLTPCTS